MMMGSQFLHKRGSSPDFSADVLWPNGWVEQDATWYEGRPHCVRWGPSSPLKKWHNHPQFSVHVSCGETAG